MNSPRQIIRLTKIAQALYFAVIVLSLATLCYEVFNGSDDVGIFIVFYCLGYFPGWFLVRAVFSADIRYRQIWPQDVGQILSCAAWCTATSWIMVVVSFPLGIIFALAFLPICLSLWIQGGRLACISYREARRSRLHEASKFS